MIELPYPRVLRYRAEELYRVRPVDVDPGVDWVHAYIQEQNPGTYINNIIFDPKSEYFYVIITPGPFDVEYSERLEGSTIVTEERLVY